MKELVRKGHKAVAQYMRRAGYTLVDSYETEAGYTAEYSKTAAGITLAKAVIYFTKNWRVSMVEDGTKVYR